MKKNSSDINFDGDDVPLTRMISLDFIIYLQSTRLLVLKNTS